MIQIERCFHLRFSILYLDGAQPPLNVIIIIIIFIIIIVIIFIIIVASCRLGISEIAQQAL